VNWNASGSQIAIGTHTGLVKVWDVHASVEVQEYTDHTARVGTSMLLINIQLHGTVPASLVADETAPFYIAILEFQITTTSIGYLLIVMKYVA
jgi:hypothetical protein